MLELFEGRAARFAAALFADLFAVTELVPVAGPLAPVEVLLVELPVVELLVDELLVGELLEVELLDVLDVPELLAPLEGAAVLSFCAHGGRFGSSCAHKLSAPAKMSITAKLEKKQTTHRPAHAAQE
jgi:hypothetical protein